MNTTLLIGVLAMSSCFAGGGGEDLQRVKVAPGISVLLPGDFFPMDTLDIANRYPSKRAPLAAYTNPDRTVDFTIAYSPTSWPDADVHLAGRFFKASLANLFDRIDMIDEGIHEINGKEYVFFEFEYMIAGQQGQAGLENSILNYTYIQYLVQPKRTLVISFNCPRRLRPEWQETAGRIMNSLRIK